MVQVIRRMRFSRFIPIAAVYVAAIFLVAVLSMGSLPVRAQIAPGVQQSAAQTATITGTVVQSDGMPVAGADVQLIGPAARFTTKSDIHGTFVFTSVPYGAYRIDVSAAIPGTASRDKIAVNGDTIVAIQYAPRNVSGLKEIARVSTHSAGAQINVTPASIASINPNEYALQGNTSWQHLLNGIPGVTVGGDLDAGSSAYNVIPDAPFQPVILSINGALPYETSVTLDGMPLVDTSVTSSPGAGTNLTYLPMLSFDTADVVRGPGANAPSIVDSVGGSFVLHSPGRVEKNQFSFSMSTDPYGGLVSNAKAALRVGRFSATIIYGTNNSPGPLGSQSIIPAYIFAPSTINGQAFNGCQPGGPGGSASCRTLLPNTAYQNAFYHVQDGLLYCCIQTSTNWTQHQGAAALSYDFTPSITAQVFYAGSSSQMQLGGAELPVEFTPGAGYGGSIAPGSYGYIQNSLEPVSQAASLLEEKVTAYFGRGVLRLAALQHNSFTIQNIQNLYPPSGQYTVWGTGYFASAPNTPVNFNGVSAALTFPSLCLDQKYWVNNRDLLASYAMQMGSAHVGISYVTSYYNNPGEIELAIGSFHLPTSGLSNAVSERTNELRLNAGTEVSNKLSVDASWYFARGSYHVPDPNDITGNTYSTSVFPYSAPRIGIMWRANPDVVFRAAMGGGYALPPISSLVGSNQVPDCSSGIFCVESLTNLNLQPEKSFGFDLGTDMRLHHDMVLSLDLYRTNLYGQFFSSVILNSTNYNGTGLPLYTSEEGNLSQSRYEGINIDIRKDVPKGVYWHGALGLTRAYVVSVPNGFYDDPTVPCTNCANTYIVPNINFDGQYQSTVPYANGAAQIGYRWSPEKYLDISPTYYGNNNPYFVPAFIEVDAHAGYLVTKNLSLLATFRNITGIYDKSYQLLSPSLGAPTVGGQQPFPLYGLPYGPRTVIVTALFTL